MNATLPCPWGSPPLNTAELTYMDPLDRQAVAELVSMVNGADDNEIVKLGGGQAWLTTRLLAEMWDGMSLDDAAEAVFDGSIATFRVWERQLGVDGRDLVHKIPPGGLPRSELRRAPWSRRREAVRESIRAAERSGNAHRATQRGPVFCALGRWPFL